MVDMSLSPFGDVLRRRGQLRNGCPVRGSRVHGIRELLGSSRQRIVDHFHPLRYHIRPHPLETFDPDQGRLHPRGAAARSRHAPHEEYCLGLSGPRNQGFTRDQP